jgi:hypothetical protein
MCYRLIFKYLASIFINFIYIYKRLQTLTIESN